MITQYPQQIVNIDYAHQKVHEGRFFSGSYYNSSVADAASINLLIQNTSQYSHSKIAISASGDCLLYLFEDTTFSGAGTAVDMINHNRASSKVFAGTVTHTPTITLDGTQLNGAEFLPGGNKHIGGGAGAGFENELILDINTNYMFRLTNISGSSAKLYIHFDCYQPTL